MNKEQFYELLDIENAEDFQYFENLAAFFECEEELDYDDVARLFEEVDKTVLAELVDEYFEEITNFVPGSETEVFSILENVRRALVGMCRNCAEDENLRSKLIEELERFRRWYSIDSCAYCTDPATLAEEEKSMRDALLLARLEKLEHNGYQYDFSECMNYPLDEYIVSLGDLAAAEDAEAEAALIAEDAEAEKDAAQVDWRP